jgi:hypothetical protein
MQVPQEIIALVETGLSRMRARPDHHYDWRIRRTLYQQMNIRYNQIGYDAHGWLAVLTAEFVLPIFRTAIPGDPLPEQLLDCAQQVMRRAVPRDSAVVIELLDEGYLGTGPDCMDWRDTIAYNAEYAGEATYVALEEANGSHNLLEAIEECVRGEGVVKFDLPEGMTLDDLTDYEIADIGLFKDTASTAAIAYSCDKDGFQLDPQRLMHFWEWWATHAISEAWSRCTE